MVKLLENMETIIKHGGSTMFFRHFMIVEVSKTHQNLHKNSYTKWWI